MGKTFNLLMLHFLPIDGDKFRMTLTAELHVTPWDIQSYFVEIQLLY